MPIYEYINATEASCAHCQAGLEVLQSVSAEPLIHCTHCGSPVKRRICAPNIASSGADQLQPGNLEKHGFTQYRKSAKGVYEKTAGRGPEVLTDDGK